LKFCAPGAKECFLLDDALAARVGDTKTPQGIFALCEGTLITPGLPAQINGGCLMLHALQDPGNVGTILRSAESFGLSAVILSGCPDVTSPKVLRAGMGAAFRIPIFEADILFAIDALHASGHRVYAASLGEGAVSVEDVNLKSAAVVIGNEGSGLAGDVVSRCDSAVILPSEKKANRSTRQWRRQSLPGR
jgi:TrmH family RNA methyltransferase